MRVYTHTIYPCISLIQKKLGGRSSKILPTLFTTFKMYFIQLFTTLLTFIGALDFVNADTYTNPIRAVDGSDPFVVYTGGYYYLLTTSWTDVRITRATTLEGLKSGDEKVVYSTTVASRCCNVWSPEVHYIDDMSVSYVVRKN